MSEIGVMDDRAYTRNAQRVRRRREAERARGRDVLAERRTFQEMVRALGAWWDFNALWVPLSGGRPCWTLQELVRARRAELAFNQRVTIEVRETAERCGACGRSWRAGKPIVRWVFGRVDHIAWCSCGRIRFMEVA